MIGWHRRRFAAALLAGVAAPGVSGAQDLRVGGEASRLGPAARDENYEPPLSLNGVIDLYRRMGGPVLVNGVGPFPFVADTGANQSVISAELATQLRLPVGAPQPLNGVAGVQITPTVSAQLKVGGRPERNATLFVLPEKAIGSRGMLGLDQLDGACLTLDFQRQEICVDQGTSLPGEGAEHIMRARRRDGQLTLVDADLAGVRVTAFIDSGAQDTIGNMALRQLALVRYPTIPWRTTPIVSVTGQTIEAEFADLPALRLGGLTLPTWPVAFADLHIFRLWNLIDRPAVLIGVDVLSRFETVCLDFRHDEVRFRTPQGT
jgi:hypothetical protein